MASARKAARRSGSLPAKRRRAAGSRSSRIFRPRPAIAAPLSQVDRERITPQPQRRSRQSQPAGQRVSLPWVVVTTGDDGGMTVVAMSEAELARAGPLRDVAAGRLAVDRAAALMGVSRRQALRLLRRFREGGPAALASRRRGRPSNRRLPDAVRAAALSAVRERYADFGPTLAAEKLASLHDIHDITVSRETLREGMVAEGLWADRKTRARPVHQPRGRRDCPGELVQIDGSRHWWFE